MSALVVSSGASTVYDTYVPLWCRQCKSVCWECIEVFIVQKFLFKVP